MTETELVDALVSAGLARELASKHSKDYFSYFDAGKAGKVSLLLFIKEFVRMSCFNAILAMRRGGKMQFRSGELQEFLAAYMGASGAREQVPRLLQYIESERSQGSGGSPISLSTVEAWYAKESKALLESRRHLLTRKGVNLAEVVAKASGESKDAPSGTPDGEAAGAAAASSPMARDRQITIMLAGIDNAGKTTLSKTLAGEDDPFVFPTCGFEIDEFRAEYPKGNPFNCKIFDLAGGKAFGRASGLWASYYGDSHAVAFVVDASDRERKSEVKEQFDVVMGQKELKGKPVVVFANKQDLPGAESGSAWAEYLGVARFASHPCAVFEVVAKDEDEAAGGGEHTRLDKAMRWMLQNCHAGFKQIDAKVNEFKEEDKRRASTQIELQRQRTNKWKAERGEPTIGGENSAQEEQLDARSKVAIIFQRFDKDQDGFLNFAEFKEFLVRTEPDNPNLTKAAFRHEVCDAIGADAKKGVDVASLYTLYSHDEDQIDVHFELLQLRR